MQKFSLRHKIVINIYYLYFLSIPPGKYIREDIVYSKFRDIDENPYYIFLKQCVAR